MMPSKNFFKVGIFLTFIVVGSAMVYLVFQQQKISEEIQQLSQLGENRTPNPIAETSIAVDQAPPPQDIVVYHEIGLNIEALDGNSAKISWNQDVELTEIRIVESQMGETRGGIVFEIRSEEAGLRSPYVLGEVPQGFKLLVGQRSTDFLEGKEYMINVVGVRNGESVRGLAYFFTSPEAIN